MNINSQILYTLNERDEIIFVNDEWFRFALENDAPELASEKILSRNLWDFIIDDTTLEIYRKILDRVRAGHTISFNFRCDSPDFRRFMEMKITLREFGNIQFDSGLIRKEKRVSQIVFKKPVRRSDNLLVVCSWCNRINVADEDWREVEEAVIKLGLFETEELPKLSHGMCSSCYERISEKL